MEWVKIGIDYGIMGFLLILSIVAIGFAIERWYMLSRLRISDFAKREKLEIEATRYLHILATIGSNSPYIGLLGTVLGIMFTFYTMGQHGFMDSAKVMTGLAMALKATAMGLLVAIPSIVAYNFLVRRVKELLSEWDLMNGK